MKNLKKFSKGIVPALALVLGAVSNTAFAAGETLEATDMGTLATSTITTVSENAYLVLAGIAVIVGGLLAWRFFVNKAKKHIK